MSTSGSELDDDQFEDDIEDDTLDDALYVMDYDDYDDGRDFDDTQHFALLRESILGKTASDLLQAPTVNTPANYSIRLAVDSQPHHSINSTALESLVDDSLEMYLTAPPLLRKLEDTGQHCLAFDPTVDQYGSTSQPTAQLYVGNVPMGTTWKELKDWFIQRGYGVRRVDVNTNKKGASYAFVRFDSIGIATQVRFESITRSANFIFRGSELCIKSANPSSQQSNNTPPITTTNDNRPTTISVQIQDIHYGTLVTGAAMRNIHRGKSIISSSDELGIIAHRLMDDKYHASFTFKIDMDKKKFTITAAFILTLVDYSDITTELKFEWNFQDLKARKITPVLINKKDVYLLVELKRPPIIVETQNASSMMVDSSEETRLPGPGLIGHANAWLFRLSSQNLDADYMKLFHILHRYNLTQLHFSAENLIHSISTIQMAKRNLEPVQLISNVEWVQKNQDKVNDFIQRRWSSYPFETKFEIMKLISKHIITVYDLIVDEQSENILKMCTVNTLIALTDKIVELAPRWFAATCDIEAEDWDYENEEEQQHAIPVKDRSSISTVHEPVKLSHIRSSATGASLGATSADIPSTKTTIETHSFARTDISVGTFSRLLIYAIEQLLKNGELCKITTTGVLATKLELRTANINPFLMRKIYITPSTILYEGPYREEKCAVTRQFEEHQDQFLRVTFRDEDYRILHDYNDNMLKMYERIKQILIHGVKVCDRHYQFLAFSSSQLREHSCWMFASINGDTTADTIRASMGDFRNVHPVAKLAARLGQSFSTSIKGIKLENQQFDEIDDFQHLEIIDGRQRELCFTDGIGIISPNFAKRLAAEMKLSSKSFCPSAFQIRCGGYKGMVCVGVGDCLTNVNKDVLFRPSMRKFIANDFSIDVVRTSLTPSIAYLNRQIILLLSSLGIPGEAFLSLQQRMLEQLRAITGNPQEACEALKDFNEFGGNGYHAFLIAYLQRLGERKDPFVQQLLLALKSFLVKELRTKAKIRVPDSWSLLGVIDESRTLKYGQVFIQIDNSNQQKERPVKEIFQGSVIVTRNPCFHPGDIRRLEAVDVPILHDLKNVIVFPMDGPRPHAMEMSGGDLDGDTFWISRYPDLIFADNDEPFNYQDQEDEAKIAQPQTNVPHTIEDVCNFFSEYIAADNLGIIANSHLAFADQSRMGAKDEKCLKLARMHSVAVDFAKKGVSAPRLTRDLRPQQYPHYMEKKDKGKYQSTTVLGLLYNEIEPYKIDLYINKEEEIQTAVSFPYKYFCFDEDGSKTYMAEARTLKSEYDREIKRVMRQYGIEHEVEIVSGYILKFTSKQYAKETKLFELRNEITHAYRVIQDRYLRIFWQSFYQLTDESQEDMAQWSDISKELTWRNQIDSFKFHTHSQSYDEVKKKASAWFRITYNPWMVYMKRSRKNRAENEQQRFKGLFSFAWLVYPVLLEIFDENRNDPRNNTDSKKKRKKKKGSRRRDAAVPPNNNHRQN